MGRRAQAFELGEGLQQSDGLATERHVQIVASVLVLLTDAAAQPPDTHTHG